MIETAQQAARRAVWDYHAIVEDAERALEASGGECTPEYDALDALANDTLEYALEQIKLARAELKAKAEANKTLATKYRERQQAFESQVKRLEDAAEGLLSVANVDKVFTATGTVAMRAPAMCAEVDESNETMERLHALCLATPTWKIDKKEIRRILVEGRNSLPGCRLVPGKAWVDFR